MYDDLQEMPEMRKGFEKLDLMLLESGIILVMEDSLVLKAH
jgi:hypothetical protein